VLSVLDRKWREHLYEMDYLREGIGLRGYGQRDPLIEYQREGYDMFSAMMDGIKEESVGHLFNLEIQVQENPIVEEGGAAGGLLPGAPAGPAPGGAVTGGAAAPGGAAPGAAGPGGAGPGGPGPGGAGPGGAGPGGTGRAARRGVPAQGGPGGANARGAAPAGARGAASAGAGDGRSGGAQGGTAAPRRDGRVSGGQAPKRDARGSGGAHARRAGSTPEGQPAPIPAGLAPRRPQRLQYSAPSVDGGTHVETSKGPAVNDDFAHVGRNDPCPCGSGRKFKRCHGDPRMRPDG
jgi:preprotein translocase subunit SecA